MPPRLGWDGVLASDTVIVAHGATLAKIRL